MLRLLDIVFSSLGLVAASPLLLASAIAIRLQSPGPVLFRQYRVGRNREPFTCLKLRTMRTGTKIGPSHEVGAATITSIGRLLRRSKLDELPQLWNVLTGDMSLVGPRPCLPSQRELISERQLRGLHRVRPGVTGPSQLAGVDMSEPVRLATLDAEWLRMMSVRAYLRILWLTVLGGGSGDAAAAVRAEGGSGDKLSEIP